MSREAEILIVHVVEHAREKLLRILRNSGDSYSVATLPDHWQVLSHLQRTATSVILLGCRSMNGVDGADICERIRRHHGRSELGILVIDTDDGAGCHHCPLKCDGDYCFRASHLDQENFVRNVAALVAKVEMRRAARLRRGPIVLVRQGHWLRIGVRRLRLTPTGFEIIWQLAQAPGQVVAYATLGGPRGSQAPRNAQQRLYLHIRRLRRALGPDRDIVENVRGQGYRLNLKWCAL